MFDFTAFARDRKILFSIVIVVFIFAVLIITAIIMLFWDYDSGYDNPRTITIEQGDTLGYISENLKNAGIIYSDNIFKIYALLIGNGRSMKAGTYEIKEPVSIHRIVRILSSGLGENSDIEVVIPEGSTIAMIDKILSQSGLIKEGELLIPEILIKEGYLFPDTYRFLKNATVNEIIAVLESTFNEKIGSISKDDLIIASMLEREVINDEDMRLVAGIIEKRLELNMPLQIDATVAYGVCRVKYDRAQQCDTSLVNLVDNISRDNAYNTYMRQGLPIGPISNPGERAINAARNPQASDYLYYLSTKDGKTIFSKTFEEHNRARNRYIL